MENLLNARLFPRILVLAGPSGAGKSEISANLALNLNLDGNVVLIDLDLIKPLFRLRNARGEIQRLKIHLVTSGGEWDSSDLPVIPAEVNRWLVSENRVIIDVGGDGQGARILNQYRDILGKQNYLTLFVANPYRPFSQTVQSLEVQLESIEEQTGTKVKGLVSNPHLKEHTNPEIIKSGHAIVEELSEKLGLPIFFVAVREDLVPLVNFLEVPLLPLKFFIRPPWEY
ncbi:MAG: zeta toxin family protein [bacterium]